MTRRSPAFRPLRWLVHLPLVVLPLAGAAAIDGPRLSASLKAQAEATLAGAGFDWAQVSFSGRDAALRGTAPDSASARAAAAAVSALFGVRRVTAERVLTKGPMDE